MNNFERIFDLKGQVAVIMGGTGQVGYATAKRLASLGAKIVLLVRKNISEAQNLVEALPFFEDQKHFVIQADISDSASLVRAAERVRQEAGGCHILINAAGRTRSIKPRDLDLLTDEIFDEIMIINLRGVFAMIRAFTPMLRASGDGVIINISSTASLRSSQSNVAYASAKAGLNILTQTLAHALAPEIRVLAIAPGFMVQSTSGAKAKSDDIKSAMALAAPLKRIGRAEDIANAVECCVTTIRFATGSLFVIDGGRTL